MIKAHFSTLRVPLLCPCSSEVTLSAFHSATQRASHMMQMQEMEKLRRKMESHLVKFLDIKWSIPKLKLDGYVPVGALLSSVALLKQLVVPAISITLEVQGKQYLNEDDIVVGIGEMVRIRLRILASADGNGRLKGGG